jgi:DNA repair protein RadC
MEDYNEKPREKLKRLGPQFLEDHELLAIILSKGTTAESVFDQAKRIMMGYDREELIVEKDLNRFRSSFKIGFVQSCSLMAAIELGKRFFVKKQGTKKILGTDDAYELLRNMQHLTKEYVRGLYLNSRRQVIHDEIISIGSLDGNILHPREIFRPAVDYGAAALILAHNHPSGDPTPSSSDIAVTKKLLEASKILQIPLLDHLIIGENSYTSLNKKGLMA